MREIPCDLCGGSRHKVVFHSIPSGGAESLPLQARYAASSGAGLQERVVSCLDCGLVFVSPRIDEAEIYSGYEEADNSLYLSQKTGRLLTFQRAARRLSRHIPPQGRLLDVGCAAGFFLKAARDAGWQVEGVEISKHLAEYGRQEFGLTIHQGDLHRAPLAPASFDVVTFWDVLEHAYHPSRDLARAWTLLKPGGYLLVNYPAFDSLWARLLGRRWWFLISVHLTYFTRSTIRRMAARCGFEPVAYWPFFQSLELWYLLYRLEAYAPSIARSCGAIVKGLRLSSLQIPYYASQTTFLARKPVS